ncbi:toxin Doc [Streptomyces sp. IBSNAI002]|uniref:toxin Doc n=1 Tax=Streptomyces sp. IBSNAI002 TaxID=3457500 RepID=UPI003FD3F7B7
MAPGPPGGILRSDLTVNDLSVLGGMAARPPGTGSAPHVSTRRTPTRSGVPQSSWRIAYGYGVTIAYLGGLGKRLDTSYELWRDLITDIRNLHVDSYDIAERLRSLHRT